MTTLKDSLARQKWDMFTVEDRKKIVLKEIKKKIEELDCLFDFYEELEMV